MLGFILFCLILRVFKHNKGRKILKCIEERIK